MLGLVEGVFLLLLVGAFFARERYPGGEIDNIKLLRRIGPAKTDRAALDSATHLLQRRDKRKGRDT